jgi:hypothetical protein
MGESHSQRVSVWFVGVRALIGVKALPITLVFALFAATRPAVAQETPALAEQAQNPIASLISVPFQNNFNFEVGSRDDVQDVFNFQPVIPFRAGSGWNLITRTIVPLIHQPELAPGIGNVSGLGDIQLSLFLSPMHSRGVVWGLGPIVSLPTATDDLVGLDKFGVGPTGVVLAIRKPWLFGALVNNVTSVAGASDRPDENQMLVQPFVNYNMAGGWYFVTSPIVTANWKVDNGQRWTVPLGGGLGRIFRVGKQPLNAYLQAFYNVEHPDRIARWSLRVQTQLLFPK